MVLNLDPQNKGIIPGKQLCTYLCLINCPIPTLKQFNYYTQELQKLSQNGLINKENFSKVSAFYDQYLDQTQEQSLFNLLLDTNKFFRLKYIKDLIYDINVEKNKVDKGYFIDVECC